MDLDLTSPAATFAEIAGASFTQCRDLGWHWPDTRWASTRNRVPDSAPRQALRADALLEHDLLYRLGTEHRPDLGALNPGL